MPNDTYSMRRWSTSDVAPAQRTAYFAAFVDSAVIPFGYSFPEPLSFYGAVDAIDVGPMSVMRHVGSRLRVYTGKREIARQQERCFNLVLSRNVAWQLEHGSRVQLDPGAAVLTDSRIGMSLEQAGEYDFLNIKIPEESLRRWVARPNTLVGRPITSQSPWGRALVSFVSALSPSMMRRPALPHELLADHVGALLSLVTTELVGTAAPKVEKSVAERIQDCVRQRCSEQSLTASQVAASLRMSDRTLHRHLAAAGNSFASLLLDARLACARAMLKSASFATLTTAEIGLRAGFSDASHFCRVFGRRVGCGPARFRRDLRH